MVAALQTAGIFDYLTDPNLLLNTLLAQLGGWMVVAVASSYSSNLGCYFRYCLVIP
mgnify:CR=1 FL=1